MHDNASSPIMGRGVQSVFRATGVHEEAAAYGPVVQGEKRDSDLKVDYAYPDFFDKHANGETM
jgi:hypothetical protein